MIQKHIISLPNPSLQRPSQRIAVIDDEIKQLAERMMEITLDWEDHRPHEFGVAMAAIQIGRPQRLIVVRNSFDNKGDRSFQVLVNPQISKREGEPVLDTEGCLSVPDIYGEVPRYPKVRLKALDLEGRPLQLRASGFLARVLQHEVDHLSGKLFIDRVKDDKYLKLNREGELVPLKADEIRNNRFLRH